MIIPEKEITLLEIYRCPKCGSAFKRENHASSCAVNHSPGSCCHFGDITLDENLLDKIMYLVRQD